MASETIAPSETKTFQVPLWGICQVVATISINDSSSDGACTVTPTALGCPTDLVLVAGTPITWTGLFNGDPFQVTNMGVGTLLVETNC